MALIRIPERVYPGFDVISKLNKDDIENIAKYFGSISLQLDLNKIEEGLLSYVDEYSAKELFLTILSFSRLLEKKDVDGKDVDIKELSSNLVDSYLKYTNTEMSSSDIGDFKSNILLILSNYDKVGLLGKVQDLQRNNERNFYACELMTDIRIISSESNYSILIHKLSISYSKEGTLKDFYLTLESSDLKELKETIDEAIKNEEKIKEKYNNVFDFVL